jgi:aspartyl protease family protein
MLRKLLILGVCAGTSASIPIVYQTNPEQFLRYADSLLADDTQDTIAVQSLPARARPASAEPEQLMGKKVRVDADARGHFTTEFKLNGRRIEAMVDTGATLVAINLSTARKIGLKLDAADFKYQVDTANGTTRAASATIDSLQVGRIFVRDVQAVVLDDSALSSTLIGMSFLQRLDKYAVENGSLLLVQ